LVPVAAAGAALITFALMAVRGGPAPALAAATAAMAEAHPATASPAAAPMADSATQHWSAGNKAHWLAGRRGAGFELLAENKVSTWFGPTQPVLVVRCEARSIETFVYTRSATRIEPHVDGKTVTVSIDGQAPTTERWTDSDDRVALFAPDGSAFTQRLLHARTLRFGYSPHNADDVVAQFHVAGLAEALQPVARECGWKK
jgi:hypothetical protein